MKTLTLIVLCCVLICFGVLCATANSILEENRPSIRLASIDLAIAGENLALASAQLEPTVQDLQRFVAGLSYTKVKVDAVADAGKLALDAATARIQDLQPIEDEALFAVQSSRSLIDEVFLKLPPVFDHAVVVETDADKLLRVATPQLSGLLAGWKVTGGEAAQTLRPLSQNAPDLVSQTEKTVTNFAVVSERIRNPFGWIWHKVTFWKRR